jgi:hypothetical protein
MSMQQTMSWDHSSTPCSCTSPNRHRLASLVSHSSVTHHSPSSPAMHAAAQCSRPPWACVTQPNRVLETETWRALLQLHVSRAWPGAPGAAAGRFKPVKAFLLLLLLVVVVVVLQARAPRAGRGVGAGVCSSPVPWCTMHRSGTRAGT